MNGLLPATTVAAPFRAGDALKACNNKLSELPLILLPTEAGKVPEIGTQSFQGQVQ